MTELITDVLKNKGIVITRPRKQAESFANQIKKGGGCPFIFPLIEITPLNDELTKKKLSKLNTYDLVIFISVNAVEQCIQLLGVDVLKDKIIVCTGKKTAEAIKKAGLTVDYCPEKYFNSEALLAIDNFKRAAKEKKIAIIRGSSGRDYLKNNLMMLGAKVDYIDVYKRHCPQSNLDELKHIYSKGALDVVTLTSASSTANFFSLAKNADWLNEITLLLGSPRMQHEIPERFKGKIVLSEDPSDETLLQTLVAELK